MKIIILLFSFSLCGAAVIKSDWWDHTIIYDIYVWTFKDSNNDGIGDIKGLTSKLDYLKDLGIPVIKLSQIYSSSDDITESYPIDDFYKIHNTLGENAMNDFEELIKEAKSRDIKVILDINLNHCHASHEWFQKSVKKIAPYTNYFIWKNRKDNPNPIVNQPPNDWENTLNKNAWEWNDRRKQFYYNYNNFLSPDFNLRNSEMKKEIIRILKFWLDKGVSGFNCLEINSYFEDEIVSGEDPKQSLIADSLEFFREIRESFDIFNKQNRGNERILMVEIQEQYESSAIDFFGNKEYPIFHLITTSKLSSLDMKTSPTSLFKETITPWTGYIKDGVKIEWLVESPNKERKANKNDKEAAELLKILQFVLPGTLRFYYGEELGMSEYVSNARKCVTMKWEYTNSKTSPMQWDATANAGFTNSKCPILRPNPDYTSINVEKEKNDKFSTYNFVKGLLKFRQNKILNDGNLEFSSLSDTILTVSRNYNSEYVYTIINLSNTPEVISLPRDLRYMSSLWQVLVATPNSFYHEGDKINAEARFVMRPLSSMVLKNKYSNTDSDFD